MAAVLKVERLPKLDVPYRVVSKASTLDLKKPALHSGGWQAGGGCWAAALCGAVLHAHRAAGKRLRRWRRPRGDSICREVCTDDCKQLRIVYKFQSSDSPARTGVSVSAPSHFQCEHTSETLCRDLSFDRPPSDCSRSKIYHLHVQVPFFVDAASGEAVVASPPAGLPVAHVLAAALSAALGSPLPLPLEALLSVPPAELPAVAAAVSPGGTGCPAGGFRMLFPGAVVNTDSHGSRLDASLSL